MRSLPRSWIATCLLTALFAALSGSTCAAQRFVLPLDLRQGLVFGADQPRTPYQFDATLSPGLEVDSVQLNLAIAPAYTNPEWDLGLGGSMSVLVPKLLSDIGLRISAQALYLCWESALRLSLGLGIEALGLVRIGVWPGYDFGMERAFLGVGVGLDIVSVVRVLSGAREPEFEPIP